MPILGFLATAAQWVIGFFVARWVAHKILWVSILTIVLPWVLKDGVQWFWRVGEEYKSQILTYVDSFLASALGAAGFDYSLNITGIAGYMATQMGIIDYIYIVLSGFAICWTLRIVGKIF